MPTRKTERPVTLKASPDQLRGWERAAKRAGLSRHAWAKLVLDVASGASNMPEQVARLKSPE